MPKRCVASAAGCSNERSLDEGISLYILPFYSDDRPEAKKRRKKWVDFVRLKRAKWQPSQSSVLCSEHFKREDFVRSADLGDEKKSPHFKEKAKDLCLSITSVNRLVLRGSEKKIEFRATHKRVHKFANRGEKSHGVLLSTSQLYSSQVHDKRGLEPNISRL